MDYNPECYSKNVLRNYHSYCLCPTLENKNKQKLSLKYFNIVLSMNEINEYYSNEENYICKNWNNSAI